MTRLPQDKLDKLVQRWDLIQAELNAPGDQANLVRLSKEFAELNPIVGRIKALEAARAELASIEEMIAGGDRELADLAAAERSAVGERLAGLEQEVRVLLLPKDAADDKNAILEVRAGTGGDEAALFAADLFRMYQRYADQHGWRTEVLSLSESDLGGIREVVANISGKGAYARLKYESGVHRVQRVPATEASGRIHTSAATVAVLPEAEEIDIEIRPEDIRIDTMRASGAGGQHVNTTDSAVRITHLPTGLVVTSSEKSQHQNRARALQVLRARLYDIERQRTDAARAAERKGQVGSGDRSQRIRTYNFPQGRVTDHRINLTLYNLQGVLDGGGLDELVQALVTEDQASQLAAMEQ